VVEEGFSLKREAETFIRALRASALPRAAPG
jgi:hypothetical protein